MLKRGQKVIAIVLSDSSYASMYEDAEFMMMKGNRYYLKTGHYGYSTSFERNRVILLDKEKYSFIVEPLKAMFNDFGVKISAWRGEFQKAMDDFRKQYTKENPQPNGPDINLNFLKIVDNPVKENKKLSAIEQAEEGA